MQSLLLDFVRLAVEKKASDLHLCSGERPLIRVDGDFAILSNNRLEPHDLEVILFSIMSKQQQERFAKKEEIDFTYAMDDAIRFRINIYKQQQGISAALRLIPAEIPSLQTLALPPVLQQLCLERHGLILITGPTGSGKSSSLAALIDHINRTQAKHIITLEDPIEFLHASNKCLITQREMQRDTLGFQPALRAALREDPDIICVAELRDLETIRLALTAAETGHLILATLHTPSAVKTLDRIIDVFPGNEKDMIRVLLAESLLAVISQQLCKKPEGGREAVFEVLITTPAIRNLIREHKHSQIYSMMQTGSTFGMCVFPTSNQIYTPRV